ncbi:MAG: GGDEF domain-containing protein [Pseudomonadota bacterium]
MRLYSKLSRMGPFGLRTKIGVVVFVSLAPMLGLLGGAVFVWGAGGEATVVFLMGLCAVGLLGPACAAVAVGRLLAPLDRVNRTMDRYLETRILDPLPEGFSDALGRLMTNTTKLLSETSIEIDAAIAEAETDPLTGLLNRRGFERVVAARTVGTVLFVDADHFKRINDEWGHAVGDETLIAMADAISAALRSNDIVARFGGEEFAVFAQETVASRALELGERVRQKVNASVSVWRRPVTVSVGVAVSQIVVDRDVLLHAADEAVYEAKQKGRNCVSMASLEHAA